MSEVVIDANSAVRFAVKGEPFRQEVRQFIADGGRVGAALIAPPLYESEADAVLWRHVDDDPDTRAWEIAERRGCEFWTADKAFYNVVKGRL